VPGAIGSSRKIVEPEMSKHTVRPYGYLEPVGANLVFDRFCLDPVKNFGDFCIDKEMALGYKRKLLRRCQKGLS